MVTKQDSYEDLREARNLVNEQAETIEEQKARINCLERDVDRFTQAAEEESDEHVFADDVGGFLARPGLYLWLVICCVAACTVAWWSIPVIRMVHVVDLCAAAGIAIGLVKWVGGRYRKDGFLVIVMRIVLLGLGIEIAATVFSLWLVITPWHVVLPSATLGCLLATGLLVSSRAARWLVNEKGAKAWESDMVTKVRGWF